MNAWALRLRIGQAIASFGDPNAPMLGVTSYQARAFARWTRNTGGQEWKLPSSTIQSEDVPDGCWLVTESPGDSTTTATIKDSKARINDAIAQWAMANRLSPVPSFQWKDLLGPGMAVSRLREHRLQHISRKWLTRFSFRQPSMHLVDVQSSKELDLQLFARPKLRE